MAEIDDIVAWGEANKDKAGTPEFVQKAERYKQLKSGAAAATPSVASIDAAPIGGIPSVGKLGAIRAEDSPNSAANIAQRAVINRLAAVPDFATSVFNLGSKYGVFPETRLPYLGQMANEYLGGKAMPADAPWWQRWGEGLLSASPPVWRLLLELGRGRNEHRRCPRRRCARPGDRAWIPSCCRSWVWSAAEVHARSAMPAAMSSPICTAPARDAVPLGNTRRRRDYDTAVRSGVISTMDLVGNQHRDHGRAAANPFAEHNARPAVIPDEITQAAQKSPTSRRPTPRRRYRAGRTEHGRPRSLR
jgi:hypothetical protein